MTVAITQSMAPLARIIIRYVVALYFGMEAGNLAANDPDLVAVMVGILGVANEGFYVAAKRLGWST